MALATLPTPQVLSRPDRPPYRRYDPARVVGKMTVDEWTVFLEKSKEKSEYVNGEVIWMAGASPEHNLIQMNVARGIGNVLEATHSECEVLGSDQKIGVTDRLYYFPDVVVVCGEWRVDRRDGLQNPSVLVVTCPHCMLQNGLRSFLAPLSRHYFP